MFISHSHTPATLTLSTLTRHTNHAPHTRAACERTLCSACLKCNTFFFLLTPYLFSRIFPLFTCHLLYPNPVSFCAPYPFFLQTCLFLFFTPYLFCSRYTFFFLLRCISSSLYSIDTSLSTPRHFFRILSFYYASPSSGNAYCDRQLILNLCFELKKNCVCRHVFLRGFRNRVCLPVCPYPVKRYHPSFIDISPTLVIDTSMERFSRVLQHENPKF